MPLTPRTHDTTITVTDSILSDNLVGGEFATGGGIYTDNTTITVADSTLSRNTAHWGGAIYNNFSSNLIMTNSTVSGNGAFFGGSLYNEDGSLATVSNSSFSRNSSAVMGGGIYIKGDAEVINSTFSGNSAVEGGGIYGDFSYVELFDSTFSGNSASDHGGGIFVHFGTMVVYHSTLFNNTAALDGGGIYQHTGGSFVSNSTLSGNSAARDGGGIWQNSLGVLRVTNSTLSGNSASRDGGGIISFDSATTLARSLISGNSAAGSGDEIYNSGSQIKADAYNVFGRSGQSDANAYVNFTPGASDFNATNNQQNVALADILSTTLADNGGPTLTHALVAGSPAIDRSPTADCAKTLIDMGANGLDQRGNSRSVDIPATGNNGGANLCDSGAYEVQLPTGTIRIIKVANPADDRIFSYTNDIEAPNTFTLRDPSDDRQIFSDLSTNRSYTVTELDAPSWPLTSLICSSDLSSTFTTNLAGGFVVVNTLDAGDTVSCTFTSTQCQPGNYDAGGNACVDSEAGHYVPTAGATDSTPCSPGSYQPQTEQDSCLLADPGFYVDISGSDQQFACPAGTTSGPGATVCTPIGPSDTYLPMITR